MKWPIMTFDLPKIPKDPWRVFSKKVKYTDGKWKYNGDSEKGIEIEVKCECGKVHKIKLGADMHVDLPEQEDDTIDI